MRRPRREIVPGRLAALTALRAYGLGWVLVAHFLALAVAFFPGALHLLRPTLACSQLAVDMFFMVSGFVLAYNYGDQLASWSTRRAAHFWGMRVARIWPTQLLAIGTWAVWSAVEAIQGRHGPLDVLFAPVSLLRNVLLLQYAWPGPIINPPSWTLGAEVAAYAAFPLLALGLTRVRGVRAPWILGALIIAAETAALQHAYVGTVEPNSHAWGWLRLTTGFVAGALYALGWKRLGVRGHGIRGDLVLGIGLLGAAVAVTATPVRHAVHLPAAAYPFLSLVVVGGAAATGPLGHALCNRVAMYVGERSYSLYLLHYLVIGIAGQVAGTWHVADRPAVARAAYLLVSLGVVLAVGLLSYRVLEYPARVRIRRAVDEATGIPAPSRPVA